jgi:hypothetical protein
MSSMPRASAALVTAALAVLGHAVEGTAGEIRGRLLLADRPAAGVTLSAVPFESPEVEARRVAHGEPAPRPILSVSTGADGSFAMGVPATPLVTFHLLAEGAGAVAVWVGGPYDSSENDDLGEHVLTRAQPLSGRVVSAGGSPIAGASVTVRPPASPTDPDLAPAARPAVTGADGTFRVGDAAPDGNHVTVSARSYGAVGLARVRAGALPRPIALGLGSLVSGRVVARDGKTPVAGAVVRYEGGGIESAWTAVGADGRFELSDIPARAGAIVAEGGESGLGAASTGVLPAPPGRAVTVVLAPAPALQGRVLDAKTRRPVARVRVTVDDGTLARTTRSNPDGRYEVRGLVAQRPYRVRADEPRHAPWARDRVLLATAETQGLDIPLTLASELSGRVVDEGGKAVSGAIGRIVPAGGRGRGPRVRAIRDGDRPLFRTGSDGAFRATRLAAGDDQVLVVTHPDFQPRTIGGVSLAPGASALVNVVLRRGLALGGRVRDEAGHPVAGAEVEIGGGGAFAAFGSFLAGGGRGGASSGGPRPKTVTGADGRFELKGLSEATYSLTVSKQGYADHRLDRVPVDGGRRDALEITLSAGASIRGTVARRDGRSAEGYWVRAVPPGSLSPGFGPFGLGEARATGADGSFAIEGLRDGDTYDLVLLGPDGAATRREGVVAPAEAVEVVVPSPGRIAGRVVDAQTLAPIPDFQVDFGPDRSSSRAGSPAGPGGGRAMARAVRAFSGSGAGAQAVHSDDGSFVLEDVPAGTWELVAQARGYQAARVGGLGVEEASTRDAGDVRLTPGNAIRGRVIEGTTGAPVLDAAVSLQRAGGGRGLAVMMGESDARTDGDGRFAIEGLAAGSYSVVAQHPDYASATGAVEVKDGPAPIELRMAAGGTLGGVVLSETGAPLAGAMVTITGGGGGGGMNAGGRFGGFGALGAGPTATSDDVGRFRIPHVAAGRYEVAGAVRGRRTAAAEVILQAGESRENLVLSLAAGARIHGTVTGLPATLRGNVRVTASGADGYAASTAASADGVFELAGAPPGPIDLRATAFAGDGSVTTRSASAHVAVPEAQDEVTAQIVFEPGFALAGTVTRNGQGVGGAIVSAAMGGGGPRSAATTGDSGAYRIEGLLEGTYVVMVLPAGLGGTPRTQEVAVSGDTTLDIVIPSARVGGVVLDAATRQPLADASVQLGVREASRGPRGVTTDSNGRFAFEDLDTSPYTLIVRRTGFELATREVTPSEGGSDDIVVELARGPGIAVEVRDAALGVPLRAVQVRVTAGGGVVFTGGVPLDGDGRGEIPSLPPGRYEVALYAGGYAPAFVGVTAPAAPIVVPMTAGGAIEIHAGPAALASGPLALRILTAAREPYAFSPFAADGRLTVSGSVRRLEGLGPGAYVLDVEGGEARPFDVRAGDLTVITLP